MGFGFNMIGFPVLILITVGLLVYFFNSGKKVTLKLLGIVWLLIVFFIVIVGLTDYYRKPVRLTKADIIGDYCIDTSLFAGTNATWQYDHYRFTITPTDSLIFYKTNKDTVANTYRESILYSIGPPDMWKIQSDSTTYHVIKYQPTLYRGHNKFFYVFKSDLYGNMFFRKVKN